MPPALLRGGPSGWRGGLTFPNWSNTGATLPGGLFAVPGSGTSGTGWSYSGGLVTVTANVSGLAITGQVKIATSNVTLSGCSVTNSVTVIGTSGTPITGTTISNCAITTGGGGTSEVVELQYTNGTTIKDCTISGSNARALRAAYGIDDNEGMDVVTILRCNIFWARALISVSAGLIQDCYIHDPGYLNLNDDHIDGIDLGNSSAPMLIDHNTILINQVQTSPLHITSTVSLATDITVQNNLLAGGGYAMYCGNTGTYITNNPGSVPTNFVVTGNYFSSMYFAKGGLFGNSADYASTGTGNSWSGNTWYDGIHAGTTISPNT